MNFHTLNPPSTQIQKKKNITSSPTSLLTAPFNHILHTGVAMASVALTCWHSRRAATAYMVAQQKNSNSWRSTVTGL